MFSIKVYDFIGSLITSVRSHKHHNSIVVGNKAKGWISKRVFQDIKARQIFRKTYISYPLVKKGGKKCSFFGKFRVLCFLETLVLRFSLLLYCRRCMQYPTTKTFSRHGTTIKHLVAAFMIKRWHKSTVFVYVLIILIEKKLMAKYIRLLFRCQNAAVWQCSCPSNSCEQRNQFARWMLDAFGNSKIRKLREYWTNLSLKT